MTLSHDICRCHDERCRIREACKRWLFREQRDPVSTPNALTLADATGYCEQRIPLNPREAKSIVGPEKV